MMDTSGLDSIVLEVTGSSGIFRHGDGYDEIVEKLDDALDQRDGGLLTETKYLSVLKDIVERYPHFIDGHAHLGYALLDQGKSKLALDACQRGFVLGQRAIPAEFAGVIEWGFLQNRPFLRAAHGVVLCHLQLGQRGKALSLMEKLLQWNPHDNQGIRFLIGPEYLRAGMKAKASRILKKEADHYAPYHYEMGLLHLMEGDTVSAATKLRRGFVANGYIAEMLCGNPNPLELAIWHRSNAKPETAQTYLKYCGDLWRITAGAIPFLRWLHMHPKVLAERAAVLECQEALLWEHNFDRRKKLIDCEEAALSRIDDELSREIVVERTDRHNQSVVPWLYPQKRPRFSA